MAAPKRATHVVTHARLYLSVNGKLEHFPPGCQLTLSAEQARKLGDRVESIKQAKSADLTSKDGEE